MRKPTKFNELFPFSSKNFAFDQGQIPWLMAWPVFQGHNSVLTF